MFCSVYTFDLSVAHGDWDYCRIHIDLKNNIGKWNHYTGVMNAKSKYLLEYNILLSIFNSAKN